jgi:hypothetical protein
MRHVYAEGALVSGVDMADIVNPLMELFGRPSIKIIFLRPESIAQVWFDAEDVDSKRLQRFRVGDFHFDHLDVT